MDEKFRVPSASSSRKRKQVDEDEVTLKRGLLDDQTRKKVFEKKYVQLDEDEVRRAKDILLNNKTFESKYVHEDELRRAKSSHDAPIENEYEHLDEDDELEDEETVRKRKAEYKRILKSQEPSTIDRYDDIKITPFNLEEELEEGEIDETGNYVFSKRSLEDDEENDEWAESVDWAAIEKKEREREEATEHETSKVEDTKKSTSAKSEPVILDKLACYKQMLRVMRPDESVQKTIRRLGQDVPKRRPVSKSKTHQPMDVDEKAEEIAEAKRKLNLIIELAHQRLEEGDMDIYQKSYEQLEEAIN